MTCGYVVVFTACSLFFPIELQQHWGLCSQVLLVGIVSIGGGFILFACFDYGIVTFGNHKTVAFILEQQLNNTIKDRDILQQSLTACKDSLSFSSLKSTFNAECDRELQAKNNGTTMLIEVHQSMINELKTDRNLKATQIDKLNEKISMLNTVLATVQMKVTEIAPKDQGEEGKECEGMVNCGLKFVASTIDQAADMMN